MVSSSIIHRLPYYPPGVVCDCGEEAPWSKLDLDDHRPLPSRFKLQPSYVLIRLINVRLVQLVNYRVYRSHSIIFTFCISYVIPHALPLVVASRTLTQCVLELKVSYLFNNQPIYYIMNSLQLLMYAQVLPLWSGGFQYSQSTMISNTGSYVTPSECYTEENCLHSLYKWLNHYLREVSGSFKKSSNF